MSEENNQLISGIAGTLLSTVPEESRVSSITVERLYNLGNYENIKYGVRVEIGSNDDPGLVLANVERILADLRTDGGVSDYDLRKAKRILETPEDALDEWNKKELPKHRLTVEKAEAAKERRRKAREALESLNYTGEHKDHKEDWTDDGFDVEF